MTMKRFLLSITLALTILMLFSIASADTLVIPAGVKEIGEEAFYGNTCLDEVVLPEGIEKIGARAFAGSSLKRINLPSSIIDIEKNAFDLCQLDQIIVCQETMNWAIENGYEDIIAYRLELIYATKADGTLMVTGYQGNDKNVSIPAIVDGKRVTSIGDNAFLNSEIETINIAEGILTIGESTFEGCMNLSNVVLPSTLESIERYAFYKTGSLEHVTFPNSLKSIGEGAFLCSGLVSIDVPDSVENIGGSCFALSENLKSIRLSPNMGDKIPQSLCYGCSSLEKVVIPKSVKTIVDGAFYNCFSLKEIWMPLNLNVSNTSFPEATIEIIHYTTGNEDAKDRYIEPHDKDRIYKAWPEYTSRATIRCIYFEEGIKHIPSYLFFDLDLSQSALSEVHLPETLEYICEYAFYGCGNLKNIVFPDSLFSIGEFAFAYCGLEYLSFNEGLKTIRSSAFIWNLNLIDVKIPDSLENLYDGNAFAECENLKTINLRSNINTKFSTNVGKIYFRGCRSLESIVIPDDVNVIGDYSFSGCSSLKTIVFPNNLWGIGESAFSYCDSLEYINFPSTLLYLGKYAFYECHGLIHVSGIPDYLGEATFAGCSKLQTVVLPEGLEILPEWVFSGCDSLSYVEIPNSVKRIRRRALPMGGCLLYIWIPSSVIEIYDGEFTYDYGQTIYGTKGSYIEEYCQRRKIRFAYASCQEEVIELSGITVVEDPIIDYTTVIKSVSPREFDASWVFTIFYDKFDGDTTYTLYSSSTIDGVYTEAVAGEGVLYNTDYLMSPVKKEDGQVYYKLKGNNTWTTAFDPFAVGRKLRYEMVTDSTIRILGIYSTIELTEVVIPAELDGYQVVDIAPNAFSVFTNLERIILPSSLAGLKDSLDLPSSNPAVIVDHSGSIAITSIEKYKSGDLFTSAYISFNNSADNGNQTYELYRADSLNGNYTLATDGYTYHFGGKTFLDSYLNGTEVFYKIKVIENGWTYYSIPVSVNDPAMDKTIHRALLIGEVKYEDEDNTTAQENVNAMISIFSGTKEEYRVKVAWNLNRDELINEIKDAFSVCDDNDVSVLYISSHGTPSGHNMGAEDGPLMPSYERKWTTYEEWNNMVVRPNMVHEAFSGLKGKYILLIDYCGSGSFVDEFRGDEQFVVITSCKINQLSYSEPDKPNIFVTAIRDVIGYSGFLSLNVTDFYNAVYSRVQELALAISDQLSWFVHKLASIGWYNFIDVDSIELGNQQPQRTYNMSDMILFSRE